MPAHLGVENIERRLEVEVEVDIIKYSSDRR